MHVGVTCRDQDIIVVRAGMTSCPFPVIPIKMARMDLLHRAGIVGDKSRLMEPRKICVGLGTDIIEVP